MPGNPIFRTPILSYSMGARNFKKPSEAAYRPFVDVIRIVSKWQTDYFAAFGFEYKIIEKLIPNYVRRNSFRSTLSTYYSFGLNIFCWSAFAYHSDLFDSIRFRIVGQMDVQVHVYCEYCRGGPKTVAEFLFFSLSFTSTRLTT